MNKIALTTLAVISALPLINSAAKAQAAPTVTDPIAVLTADSVNDGNFATGYIYYMQAFNGSPASDLTAPVINTTPSFSSTAYGFVTNGPYAGSSTCSNAGVTCLSLFTRSEPTHPNEIAASVPYNPSSPLTGTWTFHVSSTPNFASGTVTTLTTNNLNNVQPIPFVQSMSISTATGVLTPTISWTLPTSSPETITQEVISVSDDATPIQRYNINPGAAGLGVTPYGTYFTQAANEYTTPVISGTSTTSYTLPLNNNNPNNANYGTGSTPVLQYGQTYSIGIQLQNTYTTAVPGCELCNVDSRSVSFFDYTPVDPVGLLAGAFINLPSDMTPIPTTSGLISSYIYHFSVESVGSGVTYIDPLAAYGFVYKIGAGDPDFASVDPVTNVGTGLYQLWVWNSSLGEYVEVDPFLATGTTFDFSDGVTQFEILGIDPNADVDPTDITAFVTGLTFTGPGSFTGTMQPLIENTTTPLPATWLLMLTGIFGFGFLANCRKKHRIQERTVLG
jgi:hypothetical protein